MPDLFRGHGIGLVTLFSFIVSLFSQHCLFPFLSSTFLVSFSHFHPFLLLLNESPILIFFHFIQNMDSKSHNSVYFINLGIIIFGHLSLRIYVNYLQNRNVMGIIIFWHLLICVLGTSSNFCIRL